MNEKMNKSTGGAAFNNKTGCSIIWRNEAYDWFEVFTVAVVTRVGNLIVATIYLQLIQNRYMFRILLSFIVVTSIVYNPLPAMWTS